MTRRLPATDVVVVGLGWTGSIMALEMARAGLRVVAIERGPWRDTSTDFPTTTAPDELRYAVRQDLFLRPAQETLTFRNNLGQTALPIRRWGSFLPGNGVGGAGVHWNGQTWRWHPWDFTHRSAIISRYGQAALPADNMMQDWSITYDELEASYDRFEHLCGIGGRAGNLGGAIQPGGNPFEGPRARAYPAFPYAFYTRITREDSDAMYAWLRSIPPVRNTVDRDTLPFPLNIRTVMRGWNAVFFEAGRFQPVPGRSEEWNRGAYLVTGLGHCGACHTPVNVLGASRASEAMAGQPLQGWFVPNISANEYVGIGAWGVEDIVQYLRTGATTWTRASGPMAEVVEFSTSRMTDADLRAIAVYLKDQPARGVATAPPPRSAEIPRMRAGAALFTDNCAACHRGDGQGVERLIPALAGNQIVLQRGAETLARVVVSGVRAMATDADPTAPGMSSFGWRLNDTQVADVLTYARNAWGNAAPAVEAETVRGLRPR